MPIFGRSDAVLPAVAARQVFIRIRGIFSLQKPDDRYAGKTLPDFWMWYKECNYKLINKAA